VGICVISFVEDNNYTDNGDFSVTAYFPMDWVGVQIPHKLTLLRLDISLFLLFVVYLGGRSKHKWFNDRTIELISSSIDKLCPKAALNRAAFTFLPSEVYLNHTRIQPTRIVYQDFPG